MIRLHLLGTVRLEADSGSERHSALTQPRRVALLAYLALRARQGAERRDTLLGVFWPESDTEHGRGALRNALHFLRRALGPEVIRSLGSEQVWLDLDLLWCDALEFEARCDAGDLNGALALYGGDLLEGFFISGAPAFEQWLEAERSRLRQRAVEAARTLATDSAAAGDMALAAHHWRRVLELAPADEAAARCLMRLLAAAGERGEALRVAVDLQARLEDGYDLEPAEETRALAEEIRASVPPGAAAAPATAAPPSRSLPAEVPAAAPPKAAAAKPRRPPGRRATLAAAAIAGVLALLGAAVLLGRGKADDPAPSPDLVAIFPFEYRGAAEHAYLADGLADLLAGNLDGAGELRSVDPRALLGRLRSAPPLIEPGLARREAAAHGAGLFVLGSVTEVSGQLRIVAALYEPRNREIERTEEVVVAGGADDLLTLVDRLTVGLLKGRGTTGLVQSALRTTYSIEALKAFLAGEAALRRTDMHGAVAHYRRATELDSTFALAHYRLSSAAYWPGIVHIPERAAADALRHVGRLAPEDSLLVAAWHHHVNSSVAEAYRLYREALHLRPSHVEAAFHLGELLFHWGSAVGIPAAEAREPFRRVLAVEPYGVKAALHLARLAAREGRPLEVDSLVAMMRRADPAGAWQVEMEALRAFLSADPAWQERAVAAAGQQPGRDRTLLEGMAAFSYNLAAVERLAGKRLRLERAPLEQARMELFFAQVQLARGRYRDAASGVASASALPPARRLEYRAMMATLPFRPLLPQELASIRAELATYPDRPLQDEGRVYDDPGIEYPPLLWPGMLRPRRLYLLGALHVRLGDTAAALAVADSLARYDPADEMTATYDRLTRARAAAADSRPHMGLGTLGVQPLPRRTFESLVAHGRVYERWLRAELLRESGRLTEALRWYGTFPDPAGRDLPYLAPSHLRRAEIHDASGDAEQAAFHYRRFIELWSDADPELQPEVARARQRVQELAEASPLRLPVRGRTSTNAWAPEMPRRDLISGSEVLPINEDNCRRRSACSTGINDVQQSRNGRVRRHNHLQDLSRSGQEPVEKPLGIYRVLSASRFEREETLVQSHRN